jgi:hypothetical protein
MTESELREAARWVAGVTALRVLGETAYLFVIGHTFDREGWCGCSSCRWNLERVDERELGEAGA